MVKYLIAILLALSAGLASGALATPAHQGERCFPASKWGPAPQTVRPCVAVTRVYEDGSFKFAVKDADGTTRYSGGVGAADR